MAQARQSLIPEGSSGYFHCVNRCVRRSWLCGLDALTGRSFEHRRAWVEQRLLVLAEVFAVSIYAYAVMSNHMHVVMKLDAEAGNKWSDREVAERWCRLFPNRDDKNEEQVALRTEHIEANPERVAKYRSRLTSLSWFMRCLAEPIARRANGEDECTGRFWEGRFKAQVLTDERALLAAMTYVDLNPIRANIALKVSTSHYTGVKQRVDRVRIDRALASTLLAPVAGLKQHGMSLSVRQYLELVVHTGRQWKEAKPGQISSPAKQTLCALKLGAEGWRRQVAVVGQPNIRVLGSAESLIEKAKAMGQRWLRGITMARQLA